MDQSGTTNTNQNYISGAFCQLSVSRSRNKLIKTLHHQVYDQLLGWVSRAPAEHPVVKVEISLCTSGYEELDIPSPRVTTKSTERMAMADTGAQMTVGSLELAHALGVTKRELIPLASRVNVANAAELGLLGGMLIRVTMKDSQGTMSETLQLCYISSAVHTFYLSREACEDLGIVNKEFPNGINTTTLNSMAESATSRPCSCPERSLPPSVPTSLPYPATKENATKLKEWIEDRYASSAFNQCCH